MYALSSYFSTAETPLNTGSQRNHGFMSTREAEFRSALENYLSDYRFSMHASAGRTESAPSSVIRKFVEWFRRQVAINSENKSYLPNFGREETNDGS